MLHQIGTFDQLADAMTLVGRHQRSNAGRKFSLTVNNVVAATDTLEAVKQTSIALNNYTSSLIKVMVGLSDQIEELSEQINRLQNVAGSFGLSTKLR
jgi:hypothetical protein